MSRIRAVRRTAESRGCGFAEHQAGQDSENRRRPDDDRAAAAAYVAALTAELAALARRHNLDTLGYLLDMARLEAGRPRAERA